MYFPFLPFLFSFIVICFSLYVLVRDDVIFIRKNVSVDQVFSSAFLGILAAFLGSRIFYTLFSVKISYLNPFVFLLFPYFPGLSLLGGVVGLLIFEYLYTKPKKVPSERLSDFYSISVLWGATIGKILVLIERFLSRKPLLLPELVITLLLVAFSVMFSTVMLTMLRRSELKEGSTTLLFLSTFSFLTFFSELLLKNEGLVFVFDPEGLFSVVVFLVSLILFLQREQLALRVRK